jgi:hypothetical protein
MAEAEEETSEGSEESPREQAGQAEEDSPPRDRRELMDQVADARTPTEIASARHAADSWLASNPGDGDVRLAREQLGTEPEEDLEEDLELEEGSPT